MDGVFIRRRINGWNILLLLCGALLVALYIFLNIVSPENNGEWITLPILGTLCVLTAVPSMLLNHGAYIHIGEHHIQARYHWFGRLDCGIEEVAFVMPSINALTILLKNGKRHVIMGVENSWALSAAIRRQNFALEQEAPDSIRQKLEQVQSARKKELRWILGASVLLFANIFIAVLLTGGRELHEFAKLDWILFSGMGSMELLTLICLFRAAQQCGRQLLPMEQLKYRLRGAVISVHPLPSNYAAAVYVDESCSGRIVVCGFPDYESVYFCVQRIVGNFELETVHTSEIYESIDDLPEEEFSSLIDITALIQP